jgi:hypothetical protein
VRTFEVSTCIYAGSLADVAKKGVTMTKLTLILVFIACVASGCTGVKVSGSNTGTAPSNADPKAAVIEASKKLIALKAVSAIVEGAGKLAIRKDVQFVAPDRYHIIFDDETGAHVEMISVGNVTYIRSGDTWSKLAGDDPPPTSTFRNSFTDEVLQSVTDVKFEGEDTVNNKPTFVYSYKLVTMVSSFPVVQRIWVDVSSGIPIKSVAEYTDSQEKTLTTTFDIESPVTIELPTK